MSKKLSLLIMLVAILILSACSKSDSEVIKENDKSIRGIVKSVEGDTFKIDSQDRIKQGEIIITKRAELDSSASDYEVGDTVNIHYEKIEGDRPAVINKVYLIEIIKKADDKSPKVPNSEVVIPNESELENESPWNQNIDYDSLEMITVENDGESLKLNEKHSQLIQQILHDNEWKEGEIKNFKGDFIILEGESQIGILNSESGVIYDIENEFHTELYPGTLELMKKVFDYYLKGGWFNE